MCVSVEDRLAELGLVLPATPRMPVTTAFAWVRVAGPRVLVSGHGAQNADGSPAGPYGRVPDEVTLEQAQASARLAVLSILSSVRQAAGSLDRVAAWLTVSGFVNAAPGYDRTTAVLNAASELIVDVFGPSVGTHARTAIGAVALPLNLPVVIAAEMQLSPAAGES
jgi:enamine deaminase RidA (YjgF/YER057c/UK114 family)